MGREHDTSSVVEERSPGETERGPCTKLCPMADDETTRDAGPRHEGREAATPYPVSRLAPPIDLVDMARAIQRADTMLGAVASDKLRLIADQIRALQGEAARILEKTHRDAELHRAVCRFEKRAGHTYHLYRDAAGRPFFSLLSPDDWRGKPPYPFEGSYRLEADMGWTPAARIAERDARDDELRGLLPLAGLLPQRSDR